MGTRVQEKSPKLESDLSDAYKSATAPLFYTDIFQDVVLLSQPPPLFVKRMQF